MIACIVRWQAFVKLLRFIADVNPLLSEFRSLHGLPPAAFAEFQYSGLARTALRSSCPHQCQQQQRLAGRAMARDGEEAGACQQKQRQQHGAQRTRDRSSLFSRAPATQRGKGASRTVSRRCERASSTAAATRCPCRFRRRLSCGWRAARVQFGQSSW